MKKVGIHKNIFSANKFIIETTEYEVLYQDVSKMMKITQFTPSKGDENEKLLFNSLQQI